jgi:HEAT repeat protein
VGYLGEIAISDPNAIAALEKLLSSTEDEDICLEVAYQLGKIDPGNSTSISALVQLLESTEDDFKFEDITERLVEIGGGNLVAIAALEKLLKSPKDLLVRSIKHEYKEANEMFFEDDWIDLERKLSKFLPAEIAELPVQIAAILDADLIKSAKDAYFNMRWQAACALGTIDPGNKIATTVLLSLIKPFIAAREDGVIVEGLTGIGNPTAITFLVELIRSTKNPEILQDAAEGLIDSLSEDWIAATVSALKVPINRFWRFHAGQQVATCYNIIWYCAQALSYPEFYEAWHQHGSNPFNYSPG